MSASFLPVVVLEEGKERKEGRALWDMTFP